MAVINILSPHLADMIAAGEVVERPASVIKELLENSFDAGARNVTVEIRGGGTTYIRVTDDGCGMSPEDAGIAFLRHATSKLSDESGLESISTMGFRGEALAAISSVSEMEIITRLRGTSEGTRLLLDAGDIADMVPFGCPEGTTVICRDLFFNTPARLKFLKSDRSEASACISAAMRCALGRPDVSVRFIRDGEEEFFSPGDGRIDSCLYALLGRDEASAMLSCCSSSPGGMSLSGFVSSPLQGRGNRSHQFFFVNGRSIKSLIIQSALEQAYKNTLLSSRYPSCVLYLQLDFGSVDVNVHPTKMEVRFGSEKAVFDLVYHTVRMALENEDPLASPRMVSMHGSSPDSFEKADAAAKAPSRQGYSAIAAPASGSSAASSPAGRSRQGGDSAWPGTGAGSETAGISLPEPSFSAPQQPYYVQTKIDLSCDYSQNAGKTAVPAAPEAPVEKNVENPVQNVERDSIPEHKILGEAFNAYIIVEKDGEIILIDKHAAHERMIFDRLKSEEREIVSQYLLSPVTVSLSSEAAELLEANGGLLTSLGFEIEPYGEHDFIVRGVPADILPNDVLPTIEEICEKLRQGNVPDPSSVRDGLLHTVACKAAIKAGWDTRPAERERLVSAVLSGKVKYCPHGRPVSAVISRSDLDRLFKRIL